jgi:hypothetical protein
VALDILMSERGMRRVAEVEVVGCAIVKSWENYRICWFLCKCGSQIFATSGSFDIQGVYMGVNGTPHNGGVIRTD